MNQQIAFPFSLDSAGRTATASPAEHLWQMIEQVLFTSPGERVNRPNFGTDLQRLVFSQGREAAVLAVRALVQSALQQWLAGLVLVQEVEINFQEEILEVTVQYTEIRSQQARRVRFSGGSHT